MSVEPCNLLCEHGELNSHSDTSKHTWVRWESSQRCPVKRANHPSLEKRVVGMPSGAWSRPTMRDRTWSRVVGNGCRPKRITSQALPECVSVQGLLGHSSKSIATHGLTAHAPCRHPSITCRAEQRPEASRLWTAGRGSEKFRMDASGRIPHRNTGVLGESPKVKRTMSYQPQDLTANPEIAGRMYRNRCGVGAPRKRPWLAQSGPLERSFWRSFPTGRPFGCEGPRRSL